MVFTLAAGLIGLDAWADRCGGIRLRSWMRGLSSNQELHHLFATLGFSSGILAAIAWASLFIGVLASGLTWYSVGTGILALISFL